MNDNANRRTFLRGVGAACSIGAASSLGAISMSRGDERPGESTKCLDYGRSFITNTASFNNVRFWIESRTVLFDDEAGARYDFYQCGSCKSENTFGEKDLFLADNYDFLPILGGDHWLIFRRLARLSDTYRRIQKTDEVWGDPVMKVRWAQRTSELTTWEQIRDKSASGAPIVSQTEWTDATTGLRAVIECPVKTLNVSIDRKMYQVDTGPVGFPDLTKRFEPPVDSLRLAFVAFNSPDFADFIIEQPTPVVTDAEGRTPEPHAACQTYHYSKPFSLPAKNRLLSIDDYE